MTLQQLTRRRVDTTCLRGPPSLNAKQLIKAHTFAEKAVHISNLSSTTKGFSRLELVKRLLPGAARRRLQEPQQSRRRGLPPPFHHAQPLPLVPVVAAAVVLPAPATFRLWGFQNMQGCLGVAPPCPQRGPCAKYNQSIRILLCCLCSPPTNSRTHVLPT